VLELSKTASKNRDNLVFYLHNLVMERETLRKHKLGLSLIQKQILAARKMGPNIGLVLGIGPSTMSSFLVSEVSWFRNQPLILVPQLNIANLCYRWPFSSLIYPFKIDEFHSYGGINAS